MVEGTHQRTLFYECLQLTVHPLGVCVCVFACERVCVLCVYNVMGVCNLNTRPQLSVSYWITGILNSWKWAWGQGCMGCVCVCISLIVCLFVSACVQASTIVMNWKTIASCVVMCWHSLLMVLIATCSVLLCSPSACSLCRIPLKTRPNAPKSKHVFLDQH